MQIWMGKTWSSWLGVRSLLCRYGPSYSVLTYRAEQRRGHRPNIGVIVRLWHIMTLSDQILSPRRNIPTPSCRYHQQGSTFQNTNNQRRFWSHLACFWSLFCSIFANFAYILNTGWRQSRLCCLVLSGGQEKIWTVQTVVGCPIVPWSRYRRCCPHTAVLQPHGLLVYCIV